MTKRVMIQMPLSEGHITPCHPQDLDRMAPLSYHRQSAIGVRRHRYDLKQGAPRAVRTVYDAASSALPVVCGLLRSGY
jgi:hypothetical protein